MNTDLGNVIRGLEICKEDLLSRDTCRITGCLYADIPDGMMEYKSCRIKLMNDALSLLKAQEPILLENQHKPGGHFINVNSPWISRCPKCGKKIEGKQTRFCKYCGQKVKWE